MKEKKTKERKLSKAELKRKEAFEKLTEQLTADGYKTKLLTVTVAEANIYAVVAALPFIFPLIVLYFVVGNELSIESLTFLLAYIIFIIMIVVHELIHGITWACFAKDGWKSISFGFVVEYLTPYCSCNQPMKKAQIIIGALMPTLILGFLPGVIAIVIGSPLLLIVAVLMILGGGGDLLIIFKLLRYKSDAKDVLFIDHPYEVGTAVFER